MFVRGGGTIAGIVLLAVAALILTTAVTAFCPTYTLLGIATGPDGVHRVGRGRRAGRP